MPKRSSKTWGRFQPALHQLEKGRLEPAPRGVLALLIVIACTAAVAQTTTSDQMASVTGTVTNSVSGEPILRAHVLLRNYSDSSQQSYGALTNAEGKFSITAVPPGNYGSSVDKSGYQSAANQYGGPASQIKLGPGDKKEGVALKLMPGGSIAGRVLDADGEPVEGASVKTSANGVGATTDQKGQFRIGGLRPGKYRVFASESGFQLPVPPEIRSDGSQEQHYSLTYYPNVLTAKEAGHVTVTAGSEVSGVDIRLVRTPVIRISGKVIGLTGSTRNVNIQVRSQNGSYSSGGMIRPDGTFEIWRTDRGKYRLIAMYEGTQTAPVDIEVGDANIDNIELRVAPPFDLAGTIQYDDEKAKPPDPSKSAPQAGQPSGQQARVVQQARVPRQMLLLQEAGNQFGRRLQAVVKEDGTFSLPQVSPGKYSVTTNWGPTYVKSMQLGATQMDGRSLDLQYGAGGNPLNVVVSSAVGEISGTVRTGTDPAPQGTSVLLMIDPPDGARPSIAVVSPEGTYRFGGLSPGKYKLAVLDNNDQSASIFERTADDFEEVFDVSILPGDKLTKDLRTAQ